MNAKPYVPVRERPTWIYALTHPETGEIRYVGQTVKPLRTRLRVHMSATSRSRARVHRWIKSIGTPNIKGLALVEGAMANDTEKAVIARFKDRGYRLVNHLEGGRNGYQFQLTPEQKAKQAAAKKNRVYVMTPAIRAHLDKLKNRPITQEERAKTSARFKGKPLSPEHRAKIAAAHVGMRYSDETKAKIRKARLGKKAGPMSAELRAKISAALKGKTLGRKVPEERRRRMALAQIGRKYSEEAKASMKAAQQLRRQRERAENQHV